MIGAPVCTLARATARWIFSTCSVTPGGVGRALQERRLDVRALDAAFDVLDEVVGHHVDVAVLEVVGEIVVAVDARARDDPHARSRRPRAS